MPRKKKKVGAPPGNQNARKHGFYSKILTPEQKHILDLAATLDVDAEVALLRMQIRSLLQTNPKNIDLLLRTISQLCNVVRTRQDTASRKQRELIALARLGIPVDEDSSRIVLPVEEAMSGACLERSRVKKQFEPKPHVSKLIDPTVEHSTEPQNNLATVSPTLPCPTPALPVLGTIREMRTYTPPGSPRSPLRRACGGSSRKRGRNASVVGFPFSRERGKTRFNGRIQVPS